MECRAACAACCIAPSISPCAALPDGKAAGVACMHLTAELACALYGSPDRPLVCSGLQPALEMCGTSAADAMSTLIRWETLTTPHGRAERVR